MKVDILMLAYSRASLVPMSTFGLVGASVANGTVDLLEARIRHVPQIVIRHGAHPLEFVANRCAVCDLCCAG